MDRQSALAELRGAVGAFAKQHLPDAGPWCVALSGGPDSLALTAAAAGLRPTAAIIVDHGLQDDSASVAETACAQAMTLGCTSAQVVAVQVPDPSGPGGGPEAAARTARYAALSARRAGLPVLLGHTLDDQAETVLLGLGRGSGARSLAGMRAYEPPWCRPLLGVRRAVTHEACRELGIVPWQDPHNIDRRFTRSRLRHEVLPLLEDVLGGGVALALARTAIGLREDNDVLDALAADSAPTAGLGAGLEVSALAALAGPVRRRAIRRWLISGGARGLSDEQIRRIDALVADWHGQGGVAVGSALRGRRLVAVRRAGVLLLEEQPV